MTHGVDPEEHFRGHLESLRKMEAPVDRVTVVVNADEPSEIIRASRVLGQYKNYYTELKVLIRHNVGHSYGGWNDAVNACIREGQEFDRYFLIEDDYIPVVPDFVDPFAKAWKENTGYVCQKVSLWHGQPHAGASSGLLMNHVAKASYEKNGSVFSVRPSVKYIEGEWNQIHFLDFITDMGYEIHDCMEYAGLAWGDRNAANRSYRMMIGDKDPVLEPLVY
jgi:hypothetical protein